MKIEVTSNQTPLMMSRQGDFNLNAVTSAFDSRFSLSVNPALSLSLSRVLNLLFLC